MIGCAAGLCFARAVSAHSPPVLRARSVTEMLARYAAVGTRDRVFFFFFLYS